MNVPVGNILVWCHRNDISSKRQYPIWTRSDQVTCFKFTFDKHEYVPYASAYFMFAHHVRWNSNVLERLVNTLWITSLVFSVRLTDPFQANLALKGF